MEFFLTLSFFATNFILYRVLTRASAKTFDKREKQDKALPEKLFSLWRVFAPAYALATSYLFASNEVSVRLLLGSALGLLGVSMLTWSLLSLREQFSPCFQAYAPEKLVKSGPYAYFAHPIYFANTTTFLGMTLINWRIDSLVLFLITLGFYVFFAARENRLLRSMGLK